MWLRVFRAVYDGEEVITPEKTPEVKPVVPAAGAGEDKPTLTQKQFNDAIAAEKRKFQEKVNEQVKQLEEVKKLRSLSDDEKASLQGKIEELNNSLLTKEELAIKERERLAKEHRTELEKTTNEKEHYKRLFNDSTISRAILDEAVKNEAFNPHQFINLLKDSARLVEEENEDGKGTGVFNVKIKFPDKDKEGKPLTLDVAVSDAIKRMKERPDEFGNMFRPNVTGGVGGSSGSGGKKSNAGDPPKDPAEYRKWRKEHGYAS